MSEERLSLKERFYRYHSLNPHVYEMFVEYSQLVKRKGLRHYSIWAVANRVRWHYLFEIQGSDEEFKISNDYLALYARLIMRKEPDLEGFFKIKQMRRG